MVRLFFLLSFALLALVASAQNITRAYCGGDGRAHIVHQNGAERIPPIESGQVGCEHIAVAGDRRTVAWSVLVESDGTSYPIAISVIVYRDHKQKLISPDQAVWDWRFIDGGKQVAILSGPVHGNASAARLYNSRSGKVVATWEGKTTAPKWAKGWEEKFGVP